MTIAELIDKLLEFDQSLSVATHSGPWICSLQMITDVVPWYTRRDGSWDKCDPGQNPGFVVIE